VHGGLAQGIGQALSELHVFDQQGQVLTGSFMDYGVPRATSIPEVCLELVEDPTTGNPLRVKGAGESGITPATAMIFNAISHAIGEYENEIPMPATPLRVWNVLQTREQAQHNRET
jgi:carbon-monoxide dehydrogenase large subunit